MTFTDRLECLLAICLLALMCAGAASLPYLFGAVGRALAAWELLP